MPTRPLAAALAAASTILVVGCLSTRPRPQPARLPKAAAAPAAAPAAPSVPEVPYYDLVAELGLSSRIDLASGRRICRDARKNEVSLVPGDRFVTVNGARVDVGGRIRWTNGVLMVPAAASRSIRARLAATPPAKAAPATAVIAAPLPAAWKTKANRRWRWIVIHHSATAKGGAKSFHASHKKKWRHGLGYHFVIGNGTHTRNGEVEVGSRWTRQGQGIDGAHAGNKRYNQLGIGVCLVGDFNERAPGAGQLASLRQLCRALMKRFEIPRSEVRLHRDVRRGSTECPGKRFPFQSFQRSL